MGKFFLDYDPAPKEPKGESSVAIGFGLLALVLTLVLDLGVRTVFPAAFGGVFDSIATIQSVIFSATAEEVAKFLPLALFIYKRRFFNELSDGILYFAIVGLTFGAVETLLYAVFSDAGVQVALMRLLIALFFHAALTSIVGYALAHKKVGHGSSMEVFLALVGVSLLHTIYNFSLFQADESTFLLAIIAVIVAFISNAAMLLLFEHAVRYDQQHAQPQTQQQ